MKQIFYFLLFGIMSTSYAEVYKCTGADGKKVYLSHPCSDGVSNESVDLKTGNVVNLEELQKQEKLKQLEEAAKIEKQRLEQQQEALRKLALEQQAAVETETNQQLIKANPSQFSPFSIPPYKPNKLSALVKQYEARLPEVERLRRIAANKALATQQCTRVEAVELNEKSTATNLVFLVDCRSGKSFYYNETDLKP